MDLKPLLSQHPDWSTLTDAEVAVLLNEEHVTWRSTLITVREIAGLFGEDRTGEIVANLIAAAASFANAGVKEAVNNLVTCLRGTGIDIAVQGVRDKISQLIASKSVMTAAEASAIAGLAKTTTVLAAGATEADVIAARAAMARDADYEARKAQAANALSGALGNLSDAYLRGLPLPTITVTITPGV